jgi:hypothetical protein
MVNSGEVSVPVLFSPPRKLLTRYLPPKPVTFPCHGRVPATGPLPKAVPVAVQSP